MTSKVFIGLKLYLWLLCMSSTNMFGKLTDACRTLKFIPPIYGHALVNHVIKNLSRDTLDHCELACYLNDDCLSYNFGHPVCQLSDSDHKQDPEDLKQSDGFIYVGTENACARNLCSPHGKCAIKPEDNTYYCKCQNGYTGVYCQVVSDCSKAPKVTGVYDIRLGNSSESDFLVYCDQTYDGGGWTMVFKVVATATPLYVAEMWNSIYTHSENVTAALDTTSNYVGHYKNRLVLDNYWKAFNPKEVRVVLYDSDNKEVKSLKFKPVSASNSAWFSQEYLVSSSWNDLTSTTPVEIEKFAVQPVDDDSNRSFEISQTYSTCLGDVGWLMITTNNSNPCRWEKVKPLSILYSKGNSSTKFDNKTEMVMADVFAVFIR